ncbi:unnamed protein product [Chrysodeixis includens]|uniref:Uncharacterized protein n=1 Tax=Chrysodeixis includens TaxID=689277 RepID=A0A9P0FZY8_CHRIL|nr:unnamed protein product [Chrysodeixis includens]
MCLKYFQTNKLFYCLPPQYKLLAWGYIILIFNFINLFIASYLKFLAHSDHVLINIKNVIYLLLIFLELVIMVLLIAGAYTKNVELLKFYYVGFVAIFILFVLHNLAVVLHLVYYVYISVEHGQRIVLSFTTIWTNVVPVALLFLQIFFNAYYVLLSVRAEIEQLKTKTKTDVELSNVSAPSDPASPPEFVPVHLSPPTGYSENSIQPPFNVYDYNHNNQHF